MRAGAAATGLGQPSAGAAFARGRMCPGGSIRMTVGSRRGLVGAPTAIISLPLPKRPNPRMTSPSCSHRVVSAPAERARRVQPSWTLKPPLADPLQYKRHKLVARTKHHRIVQPCQVRWKPLCMDGRTGRKGVLRSSHLASAAAASLLFALPFRGEGGIASQPDNRI